MKRWRCKSSSSSSGSQQKILSFLSTNQPTVATAAPAAVSSGQSQSGQFTDRPEADSSWHHSVTLLFRNIIVIGAFQRIPFKQLFAPSGAVPSSDRFGNHRSNFVSNFATSHSHWIDWIDWINLHSVQCHLASNYRQFSNLPDLVFTGDSREFISFNELKLLNRCHQFAYARPVIIANWIRWIDWISLRWSR